VSGVARRGSACTDHRKKKPERIAAQEQRGALASKTLGTRREPVLAGFCQAATPTLGLVPDFPNEALMMLDPKLDDDIDQKIKQALDVAPRELAPSGALLHEQHQLLKRELATSAWMLVMEPG